MDQPRSNGRSFWNLIAGCSIVSPMGWWATVTPCAWRHASEQMAHADNQRREIRGEVPASPLGHYIGITHNDMPVWNGRVALAPDSTVLETVDPERPDALVCQLDVRSLPREGAEPLDRSRVRDHGAITAAHVSGSDQAQRAHARQASASASTCIRVLDKMFEVADLIAMRAHLAGRKRAWEARPRQVPFMHDPDAHWPLANVWLGVSAERQQEAEQRIPNLLATRPPSASSAQSLCSDASISRT